MAPPLLDFRHVTVLRSGREVLRDITLRVETGDHLAILGPNGSGKTTLIRTMTRECYPLRQNGASFTMLGRQEWNIFELRGMLGIVTPDPLAHAAPGLTGFDLVLSAFFSSTGVWNLGDQVSERMATETTAALTRLDAVHLARRQVHELSSGELRRLQIARALVHHPAALLLDEPGANLDLQAQRELRTILRGLAAERTGLILVTHQLGDIVPDIDRIVLLKQGRILADGPKDEILTPERLGELFGTSVRLTRQDGYYHVW